MNEQLFVSNSRELKIEPYGFEKISYNQFVNDWCKIYNEEEPNLDILRDIYDDIIIPRRATESSAGYDFFMPFNICIQRGESIVIPTGIRCKFPNNMVLLIYPRSGLGFKHGLKLVNTVGVIDSDYYNADNEGHIMVKIKHEGLDDVYISTKETSLDNDSIDTVDNLIFNISPYEGGYSRRIINYPNLKLSKGSAFCQGIVTNFMPFDNEDTSKMKTRTGGFGSTDNK